MRVLSPSLLLIIVLLSGCNTGEHLVRVRMSDKFPVVASPEMVSVYTDGEAAPDSSRVIGEVWTAYEPTAKKITYDSYNIYVWVLEENSFCGIFWPWLHVEYCWLGLY